MTSLRSAPLPVHHLDDGPPAPRPSAFSIGTFDALGPMARACYPHRHTFHEIAFVTGGRGRHFVDLVEWPLRPPQLSYVAPGQVHHWELESELCGSLVLFTDDFLISHPGDVPALRRLTERPWAHVAEEDEPGLSALVADMKREYCARKDGFASVLRAYLHVLITWALRLPGAAPPDSRAGRAAVVAQHFVRLLALPERTPRSVREYAAEVGVSVSHLNEAVKQATGHTPGRLIRQVQVLEAKRLLAHTDLALTRISHQLGFADAAYFCRFFRRETGTSPGAFRRGNR
ncbi:helix-turn-helix transcriptional regulator [Wenjunlia tyrosinilytica]|jgi:AraC-like DNA-binding protein|uniref:AraC family transcriptional regulator n=1 Tax=Wenjunlia tyrosinilytica TaxID=1544741 RepID=A0A917ZVJ5_9ACTN|nr:AraC family transcriptional regulator [Wenjunlia tyrosinilytica]GGO94090.1 AraC family transcriptional regulator [Wenjunlia tyrosinilytica]